MSLWFAALLFGAQAAPIPVGHITTATKVETDGSSTLMHEGVIDAPIAAVWAAISTPDGWRGWAAPVARMVKGEPDMLETSYAKDAKAGDATTIRQLFVARIPGRMLAFRTIKAPDGFPNFDTYRRVTTIFELEPVDAGHTRLRLTATGYPDSTAGNQLLAFFREGNRETLEQLRTYLTKAK